jgi:hypothetical protein
MEQILFKDVPSDDIYFMKNVKKWQITSIVFCVVFVILGTISFISEKDVGENRYLLLIAPMAGIALFVGIFINTCCQAKQYLLVFDNAIKYKKGFSPEEKQLIITPNDYKIKLIKFTHRGGYTVCLLFLNQKNKKLLSYKLCQNFTKKQKDALCNIGCKIVDRQQVLKKVN